MVDYKAIADTLIDRMCECDGVQPTIRYLIDSFGVNKTDLKEMNFDEDDIDAVTEPMIQHAGEMLGYIIELVSDDDELIEHVLPNLGYSHEESLNIIKGIFGNEDRLIQTYDALINCVIEAVNDEAEVRNVFKNLGFENSEIHELLDY